MASINDSIIKLHIENSRKHRDCYIHAKDSKPTGGSPNVEVEVNAYHLSCHQEETTNCQKRKPATKGIPMVHAVMKCVQTLSELLAAYRAPFSQSV